MKDENLKTIGSDKVFAQDTQGLTKREYFAAAALTGLLGDNEYINSTEHVAVEIADELIKKLNENTDLRIASIED